LEEAMTNRTPLIVVVDDDPSMGQALGRLLGAAGFRVRVFGSAEALHSADGARDADCLVLDMRLPGESGAACYVSLPDPRPPAVFISAQDGLGAHRAALEAGAQAFLAKPFDGSVFLGAVKVAVGRDHRMRNQRPDRPPGNPISHTGANE
jgi:FixJ family two-component response regulator